MYIREAHVHLTYYLTSKIRIMSNVVSWSIQLSVKEGQMENARELSEEMIVATRNEPGTLAYEWYVSDDGAICHIHEKYADSDAVLAHLGAFGANFMDRFMQIFQPTALYVYGNPNAAAKEVLDNFGAVYLPPFGGFTR